MKQANVAPIAPDETLTRTRRPVGNCDIAASSACEVNGFDIRSPPIDHSAALLRAVRQRIAEIGVTYATIDAVAGFSPRYVSKILRGEKGLSIASMFALLGAIGMVVRLDPDPARLAKLKRRSDWIPRRRNGPQYRPRDLQIAADAIDCQHRQSGCHVANAPQRTAESLRAVRGRQKGFTRTSSSRF